MAILFGIDGTGPYSGSEYKEGFKNSFVNQMCGSTNYVRGPGALGEGLDIAIMYGVDYIKRELKTRPTEKVLLTGYSRGGLGVVVIAKRLKREKIPVHAMVLFDCVDRHTDFDAEYIPDNVANVLHIRRDPKANSRMSFGNDGTKYTTPTKYEEKFYFGTHGAMGGTYWKPVEKDGQKWSDLVDEGSAEAVANTSVFSWSYKSDVKKYKTKVTFRQDQQCSAKIASENNGWLSRFGFPLISGK